MPSLRSALALPLLFLWLVTAASWSAMLPQTDERGAMGLDAGDLFSTDVDSSVFAPVLAALQAGNPALARTRLQELRNQIPGHPGTHELDGTIALLEGDVERAVDALTTAAALIGDEPTVLAKLGAALASAGDLTAAHDKLAHAIEIAPNHELARLMLGRLARAAGDVNTAIAHYHAGLGDGLSPAHRELAEILIAERRRTELTTLLDPLAGAQEPEAATLLLRAALADGDATKAGIYLDTARSLGAPERDLALYGAVIDRLDGRLDASATVLERLLDEHPDSPLLAYELAVTEAARQRFDTSARLAALASERLPPNHELRVRAAELLIAVGSPDTAVDVIRPYASIPATSPVAMVRAARTAFHGGELDLALAISDQLVATAPDYPAGYPRPQHPPAAADADEDADSEDGRSYYFVNRADPVSDWKAQLVVGLSADVEVPAFRLDGNGLAEAEAPSDDIVEDVFDQLGTFAETGDEGDLDVEHAERIGSIHEDVGFNPTNLTSEAGSIRLSCGLWQPDSVNWLATDSGWLAMTAVRCTQNFQLNRGYYLTVENGFGTIPADTEITNSTIEYQRAALVHVNESGDAAVYESNSGSLTSMEFTEQ
jgi:predicted Zn-dependent protease